MKKGRTVLADALRRHEPVAGMERQARKAVVRRWSRSALHMHERVSTQAILRVLARQDVQRDLFADPAVRSNAKAVQFYRHDVDWTNRMILGDSLQVMASLARREDQEPRRPKRSSSSLASMARGGREIDTRRRTGCRRRYFGLNGSAGARCMSTSANSAAPSSLSMIRSPISARRPESSTPARNLGQPLRGRRVELARRQPAQEHPLCGNPPRRALPAARSRGPAGGGGRSAGRRPGSCLPAGPACGPRGSGRPGFGDSCASRSARHGS